MSIPSDSQPNVSLSELAQADRTLTISDMMNLVIPNLLNIPKDISVDNNYSPIVNRRLTKFKMDLEHIKDQFDRLKDQFDRLTVLERQAGKDIKDLLGQVIPEPPITVFIDDSRYSQLEAILKKLKINTPASTYGSLLHGLADLKPRGHEPEYVPRKLESESPGINPLFESPAAFRQLTKSYELLDPLLKECLLYFSVFPEDAEINKRIVIYLWIGEQLIGPPADDDAENNGHKILNILIEHGFLEDVVLKGRVTSRCRVRPFIRSMLKYLAKASGFVDYLDDWEYSGDNLIHGNKRRVCLVKPEIQTSSSSLVHLRKSRATELECIETLFNVNKCYLDIKLHWFWKMKNIKALFLGRCDSKAIQHIEVKSCKFLAGLMYMKGLRLLSLQGVSKIVKLPDSVGYAKSLRILDLRDCNDMEELPEAVKSLVKLTHLDLTGCYSLACLPKGISSLSKLQVLKGFHIREKHPNKKDLCSFQDLTRLKKLRKLSITSSLRSFPEDKHLESLSKMEELRKLTIAWRGFYMKETVEKTGLHIPDKFLEKLEKLDLQHIPCKTAPAWLAPDKLLNLNKLYIKGGKYLEDLGNKIYPEVERLRLLHLPSLSTCQLGDFPKLRYLELVKCSCHAPVDNTGKVQVLQER